MIPERVLIVDDDTGLLESLAEALSGRGYNIETADSAEGALERLAKRTFAVVVTDVNMPGASGLDLLAAVRQRCPDTLCVLVTGFATLDTSLQALKQGAYDLVQKPFQMAELEVVLNRALDHARLQQKLAAYREELEARILARTRELREVQSEALELCDLTARALASPTLAEAAAPFLDRVAKEWFPEGLACYAGTGGTGLACLLQRGPRELPARLPGPLGARPGLGYAEEHSIPLGGTAWLYLGFIDRSAFTPADPAFQLVVRHLELALRVR